MQSTSDEVELDKIGIPDELCCNCGHTRDLSRVPTPLKKTRYLLLGGTELTVTLSFPYCSACAATATRFAIGGFGKLLIAFLLFWILLFGVMFLPFSLSTLLPGAMLPVMLFAVSVVLTLGFFRVRRPSKPRTSSVQPVRLTGVKQLFGGEVVGLRLGFTNSQYRRRFDGMNQALAESGILATEDVS